MAKWIAKAALQGIISLLPGRTRINYLFQSAARGRLSVGRTTILLTRLNFARHHANNYRRFSANTSFGPTILELGTGWFPTVPLAMYLYGADQIHTVDINPLIPTDYFFGMLKVLADFTDEEIADHLGEIERTRMAHLRDIARRPFRASVLDTLDDLGITVHIADAADTDFPDRSISYIISNVTLEHIAHPKLIDIFREFRRIIAPDGLMSHKIDMSDHYAHFDHSISQYNFLRFSDSHWRWFNNRLHYQNRLRLPEYVSLHEAASFDIIDTKGYHGPGSEAVLRSILLAEHFRQFDISDLLPTQAWIISKPK